MRIYYTNIIIILSITSVAQTKASNHRLLDFSPASLVVKTKFNLTL